MGLPDILKVRFFLIPMMYVLCLVGFCPGILDIWLTITHSQADTELPAVVEIASINILY